ncbi:MAG: von Willebrand factor type A domain-containing protein [Chitinophagaceae bacterium]
MRYLIILFATICICFLTIAGRTFTESIEGIVVDNLGRPIAGAKISEKNAVASATSDRNGSFSINTSKKFTVLIISAVYFQTREVSTGSEKRIKITLQPAVAVDMAMPILKPITHEMKQEDKNKMKYSSPRIVVKGYATKRTTGVYKPGKYDTRDVIRNRESAIIDHDTEDYDAIVENSFQAVSKDPLSTFSIDVDAASYSNIRRFLNEGSLPPAGSVRIEEMINYFRYDYPQPLGQDPFSVSTEVAAAPWNPKHQLVKIGLQGKKIPLSNLPASNLVFLIDVSGSMMPENKLPLIKSSMKMLVDQLREKDRVAIVVYAGSAGLVLPSTSGDNKIRIKSAIDNLEAGGSTAGGEGIRLAYQAARQNFIEDGNNRVILCTDGDFNVGASSDAALEDMISKERKSNVFLTVLGYGMGNYKDNKMQRLADKGNGNHAYIDGISEAKKVLVSEFGGTLFTIAKDVKLQVEFNPAMVQSYRLIGYENRMLNKEDFNDDKKDAGELGSGHNVTALYEIIPTGVFNDFENSVDPLKYQQPFQPFNPSTFGKEMLTVKLRYKDPRGDQSKLIIHQLQGHTASINSASTDLRFAAAVAEFGMILRNSDFKQASSYEAALRLAGSALGKDEEGYRAEFLQLIRKAVSLDSQVRREDKIVR